MVFGLFHREKEGHLTQVPQENGYQYEVVRTASQPRPQRTQAEQPLHTLCIPYVSGLSEELRRVCRKYSIRTVFWTASTLRWELSMVQGQRPALKASGVVYEIPAVVGKSTSGKQRGHISLRDPAELLNRDQGL